MSGTNVFGGGNPNGLYVPMTDVEQEVIARLIETGDLEVVIHGWGIVNKPRVRHGDGRVEVAFRLDFDRPEVPMDVYAFELELRTRAGLSLVRERLPVMYGGKPIQVAAGMFLDMAWDIGIHAMDPKVVKAIKPAATGFTSRWQDRDTKNIQGLHEGTGNMRLTPEQRKALETLRSR